MNFSIEKALTAAKNWQGKEVSAEHTAKIEQVVLLACSDSSTEVFQRDLSLACERIGWRHDHPMTLWVVALHANVFPTHRTDPDFYRSEGKLIFACPDVALQTSATDLFWNDLDLVGLALKRSGAPGIPVRPTGRRPGLRPYQGW